MRRVDLVLPLGAGSSDPRTTQDEGGRPKKLLIALSDLYDGFPTGNEGAIHCEVCFLGDPDGPCPNCDGRRVVELFGTPEELIEGNAKEVYRVVALIAKIAQHEFPHSPNEYLETSAIFISAYEFLMPFLVCEIRAKEQRERARENAFRKS